MTNLLKWGADWLSTMSNLHAVETVAVTTNGVTRTVSAILADEAGRLLPGKTQLRTEHTVFLFESSEVAAEGISFIRGTLIEWNDSFYEVVSDAGRFWTYNDTFKKKILVRTKHVSNPTSS